MALVAPHDRTQRIYIARVNSAQMQWRQGCAVQHPVSTLHLCIVNFYKQLQRVRSNTLLSDAQRGLGLVNERGRVT